MASVKNPVRGFTEAKRKKYIKQAKQLLRAALKRGEAVYIEKGTIGRASYRLM